MTVEHTTRACTIFHGREEHEQLKRFVSLLQEELQACKPQKHDLQMAAGLHQQQRTASPVVSLSHESSYNVGRELGEGLVGTEVVSDCHALLERMQHQVLRQRRSTTPSPPHILAPSMIEELDAQQVCDGGRCASACAEENCRLTLAQARREIEALDHTVGELIVEIMDMLMAMSAFHKDQMQVSKMCSLIRFEYDAACTMSIRSPFSQHSNLQFSLVLLLSYITFEVTTYAQIHTQILNQHASLIVSYAPDHV